MFNRKFYINRWTKTFFDVFGDKAEASFLYLKSISSILKNIDYPLYGVNSARMLEEIIRQAVNLSGADDKDAAENAIRFVCLVVEKDLFQYLDSLIKKIGQMLDEHKGVLNVTLEIAAPIDSNNMNDIITMIKEKTGTADVKINTVIKPELLGGYLMSTENFFIDATLKEQIEKMTAELKAAVMSVKI